MSKTGSIDAVAGETTLAFDRAVYGGKTLFGAVRGGQNQFATAFQSGYLGAVRGGQCGARTGNIGAISAEN